MAIVYFMKEAAVNHTDEGDFCETTHHGFVPNPSELPCCLYGLHRQHPNQNGAQPKIGLWPLCDKREKLRTN